jgi:hypothetical protein
VSESLLSFDEWVRPFRDEAAADNERSDLPTLIEWFRAVFDEAGPVSRDDLERRYEVRQLQLARDAVRLVLSDAAATSDFGGDVVVDVEGRAIRISVDGSFTTASMMEFERAAAIAEVADYLQEHISEALWRAWPVCRSHDLGLRATARDGEPVWWCETGSHVVGTIGGLPAAVT